MKDVKVDETLWASSMMPEGILERWFVSDGAVVVAGDRIAEIRIEDALHEVVAPTNGRLSVVTAPKAVIEPGSLLARLTTDESST